MERVITLMGMSGVGKTHLSLQLAEWGWYHYSCDPEIGCNIMQDEIIESVKRDVMAHHQLRAYVESGVLRIKNNITPENISTLAAYLGKIGNPTQGRLGKQSHGGMPLKEFKRRQQAYYEAECKSLLNIKERIKKAEEEGYSKFVNDSTGSLCEINEQEVLDYIGQNTEIIYIKASTEEEEEVVRRSIEYPKPLFYPADKLDEWLEEYKRKENVSSTDDIEPDDFSRWVFPRLFEERLPKYQEIADKYGRTISSREIKDINSEEDFLALLD
ncbi:MAG: ATPase [Pseudomonadota bacterium]